MFWFIVAVILFIIILRMRADQPAPRTDEYQRGVTDGRAALRQEIEELRTDGVVSPQKLDELLGVTPSDDEELAIPLPSDAQKVHPTTFAATAVPARVVADDIAPPSEELLAAEKARRTVRNLNIMLYVGSFLIVAATALFVNLTMPAAVRLGSMIVVTLAFYVTGLVLHEKSTRLRSAATAFTGTGLAIIPFLGFAFHLLGGVSAEMAWFLTSLLGLVAYGVAALRLQSEFISYAMMAFMLSLALSAVSTIGLAALWYFVVIIGVSLLCNLALLLYPKAVPRVVRKPLEHTGLIVTPVALAGSVLVMDAMSIWMYEVLFGLATAHYLVIWALTKDWRYEVVVRIIAHITGLIVVADVAGRTSEQEALLIHNLGWFGLAFAQALYSLLRVQRKNTKSVRHEAAWIGVALAMMGWTLLLWGGVSHPYHWIAVTITLMAGICGWSAHAFKKVEPLYGVLVAVIVLPFVIGRGVFEPALSFELIAVFFAALGVVGLVTIERLTSTKTSVQLRTLCMTSVAVSAGVLVLCGAAELSATALGWTSLVAAGVLIGLSLIVSRVSFEVIGAVLGVVSVSAWLQWALDETRWWWLLTVLVSTMLLLIGASLHQQYGQKRRRDALAMLAAVVLASVAFVFTYGVVVSRIAVVVLLVASVVAIVARQLLGVRSPRLATTLLVAYVLYPFLALLGASVLDGGWQTLVLFVYGALLWAGSYVESRPAGAAIGNILFIAGLVSLWSWLDFSATWLVHGVAWLGAAVFYGAYWLLRSQHDEEREPIQLGSVILLLGYAALYGVVEAGTQLALASAGSLLVLAAVVGMHGVLKKQRDVQEAAVYGGTLALQWMVSLLLPEANMVVYAHWWALTIAVMALWRKAYLHRMVVALAFVTGSSGLYALDGQAGYSFFFLVEHLVLVVVAGLLRAQWALWWGIIAVVVAVLYFLRSFTVVLLLFLGFLLIVFVIWRLLKLNQKE